MTAGFSGADMTLADNDDPTAHRMSTIFSTKPQKATRRDMLVVIPANGSNATKSVASEIGHHSRQLGSNIAAKGLAEAALDVAGRSVIALLDYEVPFFENISKEHFEHAKHLFFIAERFSG